MAPTFARRALQEVKTVVARYPSLALPIARRRHGEPVGDATEIVIEGFPRTGTSFAVAAFRLAQARPVEIACHVHAPAQVVAGARRRLPVLLCARTPEDTVTSYVIRNPHLSFRQAIRSYLRFYEPLLRYRGRVVAGSFERITGDLGGLIREVNERYGTSFAEFEHTDENVRACFEQIEGDYRRRLEPGEDLEREVARPSEVRRRMKEELRAAYRAPELAGLRERAEAAYRSFVPGDGARAG